MSKSLGNFKTVYDLLKEYEPETIRYFILNTHYRSPLDFSQERLAEAGRSLERLRTAQNNLREIQQVITVGPDAESLALRDKVEELRKGFFDAMSDDFNTSLAISYLFALAKEINVYHNAIISGAKKPDGKLVEQIDKAWKEMIGVIGILENQPAANGEGGAVSNEEAEIAARIEERQAARKARDFAKADAIRDCDGTDMPEELRKMDIKQGNHPGRHAPGRTVEEKVRYEQYQRLLDHVLATCGETQTMPEPRLIHPVELAYIGDAVFSLYVRMRILPVSSHVQVLHDLASRMVSAVMQAKAMDALEPELTEEEARIARRGRNTKSTVPKSASVREYRQGTAFEALMGYLYLMDRKDRLQALMDHSFELIRQAMEEERKQKRK